MAPTTIGRQDKARCRGLQPSTAAAAGLHWQVVGKRSWSPDSLLWDVGVLTQGLTARNPVRPNTLMNSQVFQFSVVGGRIQ